MTELYNVGAEVEIDGHFTDADGDPVDPTNLTLAVVEPGGGRVAINPATFDHPDQGHYRATFLTGTPGTHSYLWLGTGLRPVSVDGEFYVREPATEPAEGWQPPSAAQVWARSRVDFVALGYQNPAQLEDDLSAAVDWVAWATGRAMDASLPQNKQALARVAIRMRVEQQVMRATPDSVQAANAEGIASLSVGGLSISYRDPRSGLAQRAMFPTGWAPFNEVLRALMTDDRYDQWLYEATGQQTPDFAVSEQVTPFGGDFEANPFGYTEWPGWGVQ